MFVEAVSAGIIPVVPDLGGQLEFVLGKYQFHTYGQGVQIIEDALAAPSSERFEISHSAQKYSVANYIEKLQVIVSEIMEREEQKVVAPASLIPSSKKTPESLSAFAA